MSISQGPNYTLCLTCGHNDMWSQWHVVTPPVSYPWQFNLQASQRTNSGWDYSVVEGGNSAFLHPVPFPKLKQPEGIICPIMGYMCKEWVWVKPPNRAKMTPWGNGIGEKARAIPPSKVSEVSSFGIVQFGLDSWRTRALQFIPLGMLSACGQRRTNSIRSF